MRWLLIIHNYSCLLRFLCIYFACMCLLVPPVTHSANLLLLLLRYRNYCSVKICSVKIQPHGVQTSLMLSRTCSKFATPFCRISTRCFITVTKWVLPLFVRSCMSKLWRMQYETRIFAWYESSKKYKLPRKHAYKKWTRLIQFVMKFFVCVFWKAFLLAQSLCLKLYDKSFEM